MECATVGVYELTVYMLNCTFKFSLLRNKHCKWAKDLMIRGFITSFNTQFMRQGMFFEPKM